MPNPKGYIYGETFSAEAPSPSAEAYTVLAQHVSLDPAVDHAQTHDVLNDIYKALAESEYESDRALSKFEEDGRISREDALVLVVLLAVSRSLGPDLEFLRAAIRSSNVQVEQTESQISSAGLDPAIAEYLQKIMLKLAARERDGAVPSSSTLTE